MRKSSKVLVVVASGALVACTAYSAVKAYKHYTHFSWYTNVTRHMEKFRESCKTPTERLRIIVDAMVREMTAGLQPQSTNKTCLKMLPSFVDSLPDGNEAGLFYALDLGGTNFRVLRVMLGGKDKRVVGSQYEEVAIPPELMVGTTEGLFDFIAEELGKFVATEGPEFRLHEGQRRELGFTFSFPCQQTAINAGTLIAWTKGFKVQGTEGKDVVAVLDAALKRKGVDMDIAALVNDTVGTLAGARYTDNECGVGLILGTGTNACYEEQVENIKKWEGPLPQGPTMVINMEWGNFWCEELPYISIDQEIDEETLNRGVQKYEKLISGMYLGEIVRRELVVLAEHDGLFGDEVPAALKTKSAIPTPMISKMHTDESQDLKLVGELLEQIGISGTSYEARKTVYDVIGIVVERAARLAAAGIVGVLKHMKRVHVPDGPDLANLKLSEPSSEPESLAPVPTSVAIDGGLYEHYPKFRDIMHNTVKELVGEVASDRIKMYLSKDGSGIGAALLAASHSSYAPPA